MSGTNYKQVLADLLSKAPDDLTDQQLAEISAAARTISKFGGKAEATTPTRPSAPADPVAAARARWNELQQNPLPAGSSDQARQARAIENAKLLRAMGHQDDDGQGNNVVVFTGRPSGGSAA